MSDERPSSGEPEGTGKEEKEGMADLWAAQKYRIILAVFLLACLIFLVVFGNVTANRAPAGITLTKTGWQLQSYADATGILVPARTDPLVTAEFRADGILAGKSGCNYYSCDYSTEGYLIHVTNPVHTDMLCPAPGVMDQESAFMTALPDSAEFRLSGTSLKIFDGKGKPILVFVPRS